MRIGVIGGGIVGRATARAFIEHAEVRVYDVVRERATHSLKDVLACDLVFVTLPTPQKAGSLECDLSYINGFFGSFRSAGECWDRGDDINFVLRSTVPIGTTKALSKCHALKNIVHSPEFLTQRCAITDAQIPARNIIGYCSLDNKKPDDVKEFRLMALTRPNLSIIGGKLHWLYKSRFPGVPIHHMTSDESEAVKLFVNAFFATKIAVFNEFRALSDKLDMRWDRILEGMLSDGRIAHSHTRVPGHDGPGYAGACLPKDIANLIHTMDRNGLLAKVLNGALTWARKD